MLSKHLIVFLATLSFANTSFYPNTERTNILSRVRSDAASYRLIPNVLPTNYRVILYVNPDKIDSFSGEVNINVVAKNATNQIVLHSKVASIFNVSVIESRTLNDLYLSFSLSEDDKDFMTVTLNENMELNQEYVVNIKYNGKYGSYFDGLYLSSYKDDDGKSKNLAVTQMAPASARDVFPCFDEPGLKAKFQINAYTPDGYHAISNEDTTNKTDLPVVQGNLHLTAFKETVPMCTYLVALLVSDFRYVSNLENGNQIYHKKYRVIAKPPAYNYLGYALEFGQKAVLNLEKYMDVEYRLSKLDNAALPNLYYNAMENWGLIIYREERLIYNINTTTTKLLQSMSTVIAHESAHMWYGDEVSPIWWDYVWLSEGFATYFESYITNLFAPEWRLMDQFTSNHMHRAMVFDSLETTNAMTSSIGSKQEMLDNFNLIAYQKAASVIRMMQHVLSENVFQQGLRNYLKSLPMGNAVPKNLFDGLQAAADEYNNIFPVNVTVSDVFSSWSDQEGYPLVEAWRNNDTGSVHLIQSRFYQNTSLSTDEMWWIPITWATKNISFENTSTQTWFDPKVDDFQLPLVLDEDDWFIINKQQIGYYRVLYSWENYKLLSAALQSENFGGIHFLNRAQLIDDSLAFAKIFKISYNTTFELMDYLREELDYIPWLTVNVGLNFLNIMMPAAENYYLFKMFVSQITRKNFEKLTFDVNINDDPVTKMNRELVSKLACDAGLVVCRTKSYEKLKSLMDNPSSKLELDLQDVIYCSGVRSISEEEWQYFWKRYLNSTVELEKNSILKGLACSENINILTNYLNMSLSDEIEMSIVDRTLIVESILNSSPVGLDLVVDYIYDNFTLLQNTVQTTSIISNLGRRIVTESNENKFITFAEYPILTVAEKNAANSALAIISQNRKWLKSALESIDPWLLDNVKPSSASHLRLSSFSILFLIIAFIINML